MIERATIISGRGNFGRIGSGTDHTIRAGFCNVVGANMREELANLRTAFQDMKRASVFRKTLAAEAALLAALVLLEAMVEEIEKLKGDKGAAGK
jgi:hypothetical protein